jgi:light-regulated signal transduction histidine kinase (bacteriophytochrome)
MHIFQNLIKNAIKLESKLGEGSTFFVALRKTQKQE